MIKNANNYLILLKIKYTLSLIAFSMQYSQKLRELLILLAFIKKPQIFL